MKKILFFLILLLIIPSLSFAMGNIPHKQLRWLAVYPHQTAILVGSLEAFEAHGLYDDFTQFSSDADPPKWVLSDPIGTVSDNGVFTASKAGTTKITAYKYGKEDSATITVTTEVKYTRPSVPTGLKITNISTNSAIADWDDSYVEAIYALSIGTDKDASNGAVPFRAIKPYKITWNIPIPRRLESDTTYYAKIMAGNKYGISKYCKPVSFTTLKDN